MVDKIMLLSHPSFHEKNVKFMINILLLNNYPVHLIFTITNYRIKFLFNNKSSIDKNKTSIASTPIMPENKNFFIIPYIKKLSNALSRSLINKKDISLAYRSFNKLNKFIKVQKDPVDHEKSLIRILLLY